MDAYLKDALSYIHAHGGVACAILSISAKTMRGPVREIRVYSDPDLVCTLPGSESGCVDIQVPLCGVALDRFVRVEIEGLNRHWICNSTPFFLV